MKNYNLKKFIQEEVKRLQKIAILEDKKLQLENEMADLYIDDEVLMPDTDNDCFIEDKPNEGYAVSFSGTYVGEYDTTTECLNKIKDLMEKGNYYPTIWFVSDHGNFWPIDTEGNEIKR